MKRCPHCDQSKPIDAFAWRNRAQGRRAPFCRACQKDYMRRHYLANRDVYIARAVENKRTAKLTRTQRLLEFFATHPCVDCGEDDPVVLEFDHLRDKEFDISQGYYSRPWSVVLEEIDKCEVVCANCHRRRTCTRLGSLRMMLMAEAGDGNRTRTESLEGSHAANTPRPQSDEILDCARRRRPGD